jgi:putative sterol carrier protein
MNSLNEIIHHGLARLHGLHETATVQLLISEQQRVHSYLVALTLSGAFLEDEPLTEPTLRATIGFDSFLRIADGSYSPLQAYLDGQLELKGDLELAERIAAKLTSPLSRASERDLQELARILRPAKTRDSLRNFERISAEGSRDIRRE